MDKLSANFLKELLIETLSPIAQKHCKSEH